MADDKIDCIEDWLHSLPYRAITNTKHAKDTLIDCLNVSSVT